MAVFIGFLFLAKKRNFLFYDLLILHAALFLTDILMLGCGLTQISIAESMLNFHFKKVKNHNSICPNWYFFENNFTLSKYAPNPQPIQRAEKQQIETFFIFGSITHKYIPCFPVYILKNQLILPPK
jgi:hypothetical protein